MVATQVVGAITTPAWDSTAHASVMVYNIEMQAVRSNGHAHAILPCEVHGAFWEWSADVDHLEEMQLPGFLV